MQEMTGVNIPRLLELRRVIVSVPGHRYRAAAALWPGGEDHKFGAFGFMWWFVHHPWCNQFKEWYWRPVSCCPRLGHLNGVEACAAFFGISLADAEALCVTAYAREVHRTAIVLNIDRLLSGLPTLPYHVPLITSRAA